MRRRGFTLVETLIALAVTAVVLAAVSTTVTRAAAARAQVTRRADTLASARILLLRLAGELEASWPGSLRVAPAETGYAGRLGFTMPDERGAPLAVTYEVAEGRVLRRAGSALAPEPAAAPARLVLDEVVELAVSCLDRGRWHPDWDATRPPEAIAVRLRTSEGDALETTVVPAIRRRHRG